MPTPNAKPFFNEIADLAPAELAGLALAAITAISMACADERSTQFDRPTADLIRRQATTAAAEVVDLARMFGLSQNSLHTVASQYASTDATADRPRTSDTNPPSTVEKAPHPIMSEPAHLPRRSPLTLTAEQTEFTGDQIQALELASGWRSEPPAAAKHLLFHAAITSGLDPFRQQIRLLQRREPVALANGDTKMEHRWSVETSIHGFRILGHRAARDRGLLVKSSEPRYYDDHSRQWCEAWPYDTPPVAARYELSAVDEDDCESVVGVVHYAEFVKTDIHGNPSRGWEKMPCHMLAKCAEVDAWRRLFPQELGWLRLADGADTANEPAPAHSSPVLAHSPGTRNPIDVLGEPPTPFTTHAPAAVVDASAAVPGEGPRPQAPSADTTAAQTERGSSEAAPPEAPTAKRSTRRPATSRRVNTDKDADPRTALLATAATALDRSPEDVFVWATEQLGRPVNNADDLSAADLPRLRAALPSPTPRDNNASSGSEKPAPKP